MFYSDLSPSQQIFNLLVDVILSILLIWYLIDTYNKMTPEDRKNWWTFFWRWLKHDTINPSTPIYLIGFMAFILLFNYIFGIQLHSKEAPYTLYIFNKKVIAFLVFIVVLNVISFVFNLHIVEYIYDNTAYYWNKYVKWMYNSSSPSPFQNVPSPDKLVNSALASATASPQEDTAKSTPTPTPEVFNIGGNIFTYTDAKAACMAVGSRLATYEELENAYNSGAEWCNYGWTDGQLALFPTQKTTWVELQKNKKTMHQCGRPGINGGHIRNPNITYGANCYGIKPTNLNFVPTTIKVDADIDPIDPKVEYWKSNKDKLSISPYNKSTWSSKST
jgi:hypothetical protein